MDSQRKKGVLDICVLAILSRGDSYGYELIGQMARCMPVSESTLYPILKRLESSSCLETYKQEHNGRIRKYYRIRPEGRERIAAFLEEWAEMEQIYSFVRKMSGEDAE